MLNYCFSLIFNNNTTGNEVVKRFVEHYLLSFFYEDLQWLANIVHPVPNFPHPGIEFHHMLNISQQSGGLALCTFLLQTHFTGDWVKINAVTCCEIGSFVYVSALTSQIDVFLMLICKAGKFPLLTVSVIKSSLHILSLAFNNLKKKWIKMKWDVVPRSTSVVVVNDVFFIKEMLCVVQQLLEEADISTENVSIMIMVKFSVYHG